ncbi:MAG: preprotein translocase subunit YajC [Clostridiales bacterium]|nr:preprotein translocase subunit YajC [Candidatus Crickella equi]
MGINGMNILLLVAFIALIYFMMIRPQKKKEKADNEMRESLKVGDEVMTIGGVVGKIIKITDRTVIITTGADKTKIEFIKSAIASSKSADAAAAAKKTAKKDAEDDNLDEKAPSKEKKVAPKKLTKKSDENKAEEKAE